MHEPREMHIYGIEKTIIQLINEIEQINMLQYVIGLFNYCLQTDTHMVKDGTIKKLHKIKFIRCKNELLL